MKIQNYTLLAKVFFIAGGLFAAAGVRADLFTPYADEPPQTCNLGFVNIVAGLNLFTGQPDATAEFPSIVKCPDPDPNHHHTLCSSPIPPGEYAAYVYSYTYAQVCPSIASLSVPSESEVIWAGMGMNTAGVVAPGAMETPTGIGTLYEERILKLSANSTNYSTVIFTPPTYKKGLATAAVKGGTKVGRCPIAGVAVSSDVSAGNEVSVLTGNIAGVCDFKVEVARGSKTRVTNVEITNPVPTGDPLVDVCTVTNVGVPTINGKPIFTELNPYDPPGAVGSCIYSYLDTSGQLIQTTCTTCCVRKTDNRCVAKSTLSSPTTQCKTGTL